MSRFHPIKIVLTGLFLLTSCMMPPASTTPNLPPASKEAEQYLRRGEPKKAAQLYQRLADNDSLFQDQFRLRAIEALIQAGDSSTAKTYANAIDPSNLSNDQRNQLNLYYAQIDLSFGEAEQAIGRLNLINPNQFSRPDLVSYYQSQAFGYSLTGQLLKSAAARTELSRFLSPIDQEENNSAILETLSLLPEETLERNQNQPSYIFSGWVALTRALKLKNQYSLGPRAEIEKWRRSYPQHPAAMGFIENYLNQSEFASRRPAVIAVFLPESGNYARASQAIREGIMSAYYKDTGPDKPIMRFYDSKQASLPSLYHQAIAEGAELIIGPLSKPEIESLASIGNFDIPVMALNHVPELTKLNLYQFGLSPLDDTEQLTSKAWFDGHQKAVILIPDSNQGNRIGNYLKYFWERNNGILLETQTYSQNQADFSASIKNLLNINESEYRYNQIRRIIPSVQFVPRIRKDVDIILLNAYNAVARSLIPQLKYYRGGRIPVYATPDIYGGLSNLSQDSALNKVSFCDIPWLFTETYQGDLSLLALQHVWQQFPSVYLRLIAMGIDAYNIIPHLNKLDTTQYHGATGHLLLAEGNRIKRNLVCAQFQNGIPEITGFIKGSAENFESIAAPQEQYEEDLNY